MIFSGFARGVAVVSALCVASAFAAWDGSMVKPVVNEYTESVTIKVASAAELAWVADYVNSGAPGRKLLEVTLTEDIYFGADSLTLGTHMWTPIGDTPDHPFVGEFDGKGHAIYGLNVAGKQYSGLFGVSGSYDKGKIRNVRVANGKFTVTGDSAFVGGIAGRSYGPITNCSVSGSVEVSKGALNVGGIVGYTIDSVANSTNYATVTAKGTVPGVHIGGVAGRGWNRPTFLNLQNYGDVSVEETGDSLIVWVGGVLGYLDGGSFNGAENHGNVSVTSGKPAKTHDASIYVGGVVGLAEISGALSGAYNYGDVEAYKKFGDIGGNLNMGGVIGRLKGSLTDCHNSGKVTGHYEDGGLLNNNNFYVAGVAGVVLGDSLTQCSNAGRILGESSVGHVHVDVGGVVAGAYAKVRTSKNTGEVLSSRTIEDAQYVWGATVGGIAAQTDSLVCDVINSGAVSANVGSKDRVGGIVGFTSKGGKLFSVLNMGSVAGGIPASIVSRAKDSVVYAISLSTVGQPLVDSVGAGVVLIDTLNLTTTRLKSDEIAWRLNTSNGNRKNSGAWSRRAGAPHLAWNLYHPVYRYSFYDNAVDKTVYRYLRAKVTSASAPVAAEVIDSVFVCWQTKGFSPEPFYTHDPSEDRDYVALRAAAGEPPYLIRFYDLDGINFFAGVTRSNGGLYEYVPRLEQPTGKLLEWVNSAGVVIDTGYSFTYSKRFSGNDSIWTRLVDRVSSSSSSEIAESSSSSEIAESSSSSAVEGSSSSAKSSSSSSVIPGSSSSVIPSAVEGSSSSKKSDKSSSSAKSDAIANGRVIPASVPGSPLHVSVEGRTVSVSASDNNVIPGSDPGSHLVAVLDMQGRIVLAPQYMTRGRLSLELPRAGSYILRLGKHTTRVTVK